MRALTAWAAAVVIGCANASAVAGITILKADGSATIPAEATVSFSPKTGGWNIVLHDLYDIGGWSSYDIRGDGGEIIDNIVIDVPCWEDPAGNCMPAGSPVIVNIVSVPPLGISTVRNIIQTGTAETILSDVTVEQDLGSVQVEAIGILRAGRDVIGPIRSTTKDNPDRGITKVEAQRNILGSVTADKGRITLVIAYGAIGAPTKPVTLRARHGIVQIAGADGVHADINTRFNGGTGAIFALGTPHFTGRLETERLYSNPYNNSPGRMRILESFLGEIVIGKSFTDPSQWMDMPAGGLSGQITINADNTPGGAWTSPIYVGDEEAKNRIILTGNEYTASAAELGGGSVGLAPFRLHDESCTPPNGGTLDDSSVGVRLRHYGPVRTIAADPLAVERRTTGGTGAWQAVPAADFDILVDPADANTIMVIPAAGRAGFAGGYDYRLTATTSLISDVPAAPPVVWPTSYVVSVPDDGPACPADINDDNVVDALDLLAIIGAWGRGAGTPADIDGSGVVDALDLLSLIAGWGPC